MHLRLVLLKLKQLFYHVCSFYLLLFLFDLFPTLFYSVGELDHAINLSRPKLIFASMAVAPRALKISGKNSFVKKVILMELDGSKQMNKKLSTRLTTSYSELISSVKVSN